jgi:hypothetical protein
MTKPRRTSIVVTRVRVARGADIAIPVMAVEALIAIYG